MTAFGTVNGYARQCREAGKEFVIERVGVREHGLEAAGSINVGDGGYLHAIWFNLDIKQMFETLDRYIKGWSLCVKGCRLS